MCWRPVTAWASRWQLSHPRLAWLGRAGDRRCQPLAMPVMSALPAPEVKGAAANHSPSVSQLE